MCGCGCNTCETKPAVLLNESKATKEILSEGLRYHLDNNRPLTDHLYRAGSTKYFDLFAEARALYAREILEFSGSDLEILTETDLGHFGIYEGVKVPLDFPILEESLDYDEVAQAEFGMDYNQLGPGEKEWVRDEIDNMSMNEAKNDIYDKFLSNPTSPKGRAKAIISKFIKKYGEDATEMAVDRFASQNNLKPEEKYILKYITKNNIKISSQPGGPNLSVLKEEDTKDTELLRQIRDILISTSKGDSDRETDLETLQGLLAKLDTSIDYVAAAITGQDTVNLSYDQNLLGKYASPKSIKEAKYQGKTVQLSSPKRGGSKKFFVYVKDPKTKKIKKVSFGGTTGLKAKINDPEARRNFAKRHNCAEKKDKTKPGYWSCRLPRYSKLLGLKGSYSGFW
jgi:hypothetical protein